MCYFCLFISICVCACVWVCRESLCPWKLSKRPSKTTELPSPAPASLCCEFKGITLMIITHISLSLASKLLADFRPYNFPPNTHIRMHTHFLEYSENDLILGICRNRKRDLDFPMSWNWECEPSLCIWWHQLRTLSPWELDKDKDEFKRQPPPYIILKITLSFLNSIYIIRGFIPGPSWHVCLCLLTGFLCLKTPESLTIWMSSRLAALAYQTCSRGGLRSARGLHHRPVCFYGSDWWGGNTLVYKNIKFNSKLHKHNEKKV